MTDTGQFPGEGQPENAGELPGPSFPADPAAPADPGAPAAYTFLDHGGEADGAEEDDLLLMPGAQGAWMEQPAVQGGTHETGGRDTASVDYGDVRQPPAPATPAAPVAPRRPLHMGPPVPDPTGGVVRSLADRGPAAPHQAPAPGRAVPPVTPGQGPEYLDVPQDGADVPQVPRLGEVPQQQPGTWDAQPQHMTAQPPAAPAAEAVAEPAVQAAPAPVAEPAAAPAVAFVPAQSTATHPADTGHGIVADGSGHTAPGAAATAAEQAPAEHPVVTPQQAAAPAVAQDEPAAAAAPVEAPAVAPVEASAEAPAAEPVVASVDMTSAAVAPQLVAEPEAPAPQPVVTAVAEAAPVPAEVPQVAPAEAHFAPEPQEAAPVEPVQEAVQPAPVPQGQAPAEAHQAFGDSGSGERIPAAVAPAAESAQPAPVAAEGTAVTEAPAVADDGVDGHVTTEAVAETAVVTEATAEQVPAAAAPAEFAQPAPAVVDAPASVDAGSGQPVPVAAPLSEEAPAAAPEQQVQAPVAAEAVEPAPAAPVPAVAPEPQAEPAVPAEPIDPAPEAAAQQPQPAVAEAPVEAVVQQAPAAAQDAAPQEQVSEDVLLVPRPQDTLVTQATAVPEDMVVTHVAVPAPAEPQAAVAEAPVPEAVEPVPAEPVPAQEEQPAPAAVHIPAPQQEPVPAAEPVAVPAPRTADAEAAHAEPAQPAPASEEAPDEVYEEPAGPAAVGYGDAERAAVHRVMRERRDIRKGFRTDPVPHEVLLRVLEAAHTAPSVGHSQPWDFVVIRSAETRQTMHELAVRQRDAYAKSLPKARAKQFKEMKIEAILDTPVNIVVTADPTRGGRHTLGRHTQPQMAPYSSALAVENLWLAARAEGLGVGWVSFFDEREMVRELGLPEHLEVVAYLCVGYVDEFPDEPELMQAGWSKRRPLSWVVHEETYGRRALPGEDPHDLLSETLRGIRPLDAKALGEAWERQKRMTKPSGALGMLEIISAQLCGLSRKCPPPIPEPAAVAIFAGDHGVHAQGVTAWPQEVTSQMVANFLGGGAVCNAFANQVGAEVCVVDVGVAGDLPSTPGLVPRKIRPGTSDFTTGAAMTREEALRAVEVGIETARDLVAAGNKALLTGEMGIANTTVSAALIAVYTEADPAEITGRGTGINDEMHARKVDVVRRALELHQPDPKDPIGVLAAVGGLEHAALVGLILGGASLRTPVILDGVSAGAAALVARAIAPEALAACIAGHRSAEPGHVAALTKLGLRPLVDLDLRLGEGTGALLALPVVQSAARAMHEVATFDTAGVTEKG
ncbi:nicotinate-nucleotide--dimethylbenzimidazole phosphoribosyltransferase [Streptomyces sp. NPDC051162]|uniref:nicotinate-nucleotide--dimethylbenzimidazole phosphoribosyltransferase n=1 Tax=Streptomyces sp. NPDC051162 TaxID=3154747 RepID=UPI00342EA863